MQDVLRRRKPHTFVKAALAHLLTTRSHADAIALARVAVERNYYATPAAFLTAIKDRHAGRVRTNPTDRRLKYIDDRFSPGVVQAVRRLVDTTRHHRPVDLTKNNPMDGLLVPLATRFKSKEARHAVDLEEDVGQFLAQWDYAHATMADLPGYDAAFDLNLFATWVKRKKIRLTHPWEDLLEDFRRWRRETDPTLAKAATTILGSVGPGVVAVKIARLGWDHEGRGMQHCAAFHNDNYRDIYALRAENNLYGRSLVTIGERWDGVWEAYGKGNKEASQVYGDHLEVFVDRFIPVARQHVARTTMDLPAAVVRDYHTTMWEQGRYNPDTRRTRTRRLAPTAETRPTRGNPVNTRMRHITKTVSPEGQAAALRVIIALLDPERPERMRGAPPGFGHTRDARLLEQRHWLVELSRMELPALQARAEALPDWTSKQPWDKLLLWFAQKAAKAAKRAPKDDTDSDVQDREAQIAALVRTQDRLRETGILAYEPAIAILERRVAQLRERPRTRRPTHPKRRTARMFRPGMQLPTIAEWATATRAHINQMTLQEATRAARRWRVEESTRIAEEEAAAAIHTTEVKQQTDEVYRWPSGWYVVELSGPAACATEGGRMHHCLRRPSPGIETYSLRDPTGRSHVTLEVEDQRVREVRGFANERPKPDTARLVRAFVREYVGDEDY